MLPPAARLRRRAEFAATTRGGRRAARGTLVVHLALPPAPPGARPSTGGTPDIDPLSGSAPTRGALANRVSENRVSENSAPTSSGPGAERTPAPDAPARDGADAPTTGQVCREFSVPEPAAGSATGPPPVRFGFSVSRAVGNAVIRNRVRRRLRHLAAERLGRLPAGATVVVRALPAAADRDFHELGRDLDAALDAARAPRRPRTDRPTGTRSGQSVPNARQRGGRKRKKPQ